MVGEGDALGDGEELAVGLGDVLGVVVGDGGELAVGLGDVVGDGEELAVGLGDVLGVVGVLVVGAGLGIDGASAS